MSTDYCWNDDRVARLKTLWADGFSASQIADRLGGMTRNAVIGKVHRLGLSGRATIVRLKNKRPPRPSRPRLAPLPANAAPVVFPKRPSITKFAALPLPVPNKDDDGRVAFADLEESQCQWIVGDTRPVAMCCGLPRVTGKPYCANHTTRATPPISNPRVERYWSEGANYSNRARLRKDRSNAEA